MTQHLDINGKKYQPSAVIATRFGYTQDYVGRLARERKVVASRVGRQWFIEESSFENFIAEAEVQKKQRSEALKRERQAEREPLVEKQKEHVYVHATQSNIAMAQTFVVSLCVAFFALLGWTVSSQGLATADLLAGAHTAFKQIAAGVTASGPVRVEVVYKNDMIASVLKAVEEEEVVEDLLPQDSVTQEVPDVSTSTFQEFSDEVEVVFKEDGEIVRPVFKGGPGGESYTILRSLEEFNEANP